MSDPHDETQLTAYLLGELSSEDAAQVEAQLAVSAALRSELSGLRQTAASLEAALALQTSPEVAPLDRDKLHSLLRSVIVTGDKTRSANPVVASASLPLHSPGVSRLRPGSRLAWLIAASALVVVGVVGLSQWEPGTQNSLAISESKGLRRHVNESLPSAMDDYGVTHFDTSRPEIAQTGPNKDGSEAVISELELKTEPAGQPEITLSQAKILKGNVLSKSESEARKLLTRGNNRSISRHFFAPSVVSAITPRYDDYFAPSGTIFDANADVNMLMVTPRIIVQEEETFAGLGFQSNTKVGGPVNFTESAQAVRGITDTLSLFAHEDMAQLDLPVLPEELSGSNAEPHFDGEVYLGARLQSVDDFVLPFEVEAEEKLAEPKARGMSLMGGRSVTRDGSTAPTIADYELGFVRLGQAVSHWEAYRQQEQAHAGLASAKHIGPDQEPYKALESDLEQTQALSRVIDQQRQELQKLLKQSPELAGRPLSETNPEAAKNTELTLIRVHRELAHQQRVWFYREGYVRQLETTIAAAEQYAHLPENDFVTPEAQPLSTFGIDVDTASYSNVRRFVEAGQLPPPDAVRVEELINSFQYDGPLVAGEHPIAVSGEVSICPWQPQHQLLRVSLKGKSIDLQQRPPARLVFLVDTSGSMSDENKLPLVKQSLRILVEQMREQDRISIVTYSDNAGLLLDSTGGDKRESIIAAIEGLNADGSTNGEAGLKLAYEVAVKQFGEGATNRVMLCTDGDFNVGESADSELVKLIEKRRQTGVYLNIFGFGSGNLKDAKLEAIADKGNGQYIYIDGIREARKTLLNELTGTLYTIAKDVKLQLEFNPALVGSYRLIGYENRALAAKDFANDKVDAGDMGAGHSVVALYEVVPPGMSQPVAPQSETEPLKYQTKNAEGAGSVSARSNAEAEGKNPEVTPPAAETPAPVPAAEQPADPLATELCTIRVRYKQPTSNESTKIETVVTSPTIAGKPAITISRDHLWATAVAEFGLLLRHSSFAGTGNYGQVLELALSAIGDDPSGQRREFVTLVRQAQHLSLERDRQLAELSRRAEEHRRVVEEIKSVETVPDVMNKASCSGKYKTLLRRIEVADDISLYGDLKDWGRWEGAEYKSHQNLPRGYWVYVAPHWYIWGETTEQASVDP